MQPAIVATCNKYTTSKSAKFYFDAIPQEFKDPNGVVVGRCNKIIDEPDAKFCLVQIQQAHILTNSDRTINPIVNAVMDSIVAYRSEAAHIIRQLMAKPEFKLKSIYTEGMSPAELELNKRSIAEYQALLLPYKQQALTLPAWDPKEHPYETEAFHNMELEPRVTHSNIQEIDRDFNEELIAKDLFSREEIDNIELIDKELTEAKILPEAQSFKSDPNHTRSIFGMRDMIILKKALCQLYALPGSGTRILRALSSQDQLPAITSKFSTPTRNFLKAIQSGNEKIKTTDITTLVRLVQETEGECRENNILTTIAKNPDPFKVLTLGSGHTLRNNIAAWNQQNPKSKFSYIEILTPAIDALNKKLADINSYPETRLKQLLEYMIKTISEEIIRTNTKR